MSIPFVAEEKTTGKRNRETELNSVVLKVYWVDYTLILCLLISLSTTEI